MQVHILELFETEGHLWRMHVRAALALNLVHNLLVLQGTSLA